MGKATRPNPATLMFLFSCIPSRRKTLAHNKPPTCVKSRGLFDSCFQSQIRFSGLVSSVPPEYDEPLTSSWLFTIRGHETRNNPNNFECNCWVQRQVGASSDISDNFRTSWQSLARQMRQSSEFSRVSTLRLKRSLDFSNSWIERINLLGVSEKETLSFAYL